METNTGREVPIKSRRKLEISTTSLSCKDNVLLAKVSQPIGSSQVTLIQTTVLVGYDRVRNVYKK